MKPSIKGIALVAVAIPLFTLAAARLAGQSVGRSKTQPPSKNNRMISKPGNVVQSNPIGDAPEMQVAKRGTPEAKRLGILRAKAEVGLIPVFHLGGPIDPKDIVREPPSNKGTIITPNPQAIGDMLRFQQRFVKAFSKSDPQPANRLAHFTWLPKFDHLRQIGWSGHVNGVQTRPEGDTLVTISISPYLYSPYMKTLMLDHVNETYLVSGDRFQLVDSDAADAKTELQHFPVH